MKQKTVSTLDAIATFYIGNELLGEVFAATERKPKKNIETALRGLIRKANKLSQEDFLTYHLDNYHPRYDNYFNSTWELKKINLEDCGVWPKMGGLPDAATRGSVLDTAEYIRPYLKDKRKLTLTTARILYIEEMMKYAEIISKHIPIIVLEEGVIRHHKLRKSTERKLYKKCLYDIDDGNHRALAMALLGKKEIMALVGKRIYKNPLLY